jgi:hypothetical protein
MDFENFKNRPEFSDDHGGEGSVYGAGSSISRPDTPRGRSASRDSARTLNDEPGMTYPSGYHQTPSNLREYSPSPGPLLRVESRESPYEIPPGENLLAGAAPMGRHMPGEYMPYTPEAEGRRDYFRR